MFGPWKLISLSLMDLKELFKCLIMIRKEKMASVTHFCPSALAPKIITSSEKEV